MSRYIGCDCGSEVLRIQYDDETKEFYIGIMEFKSDKTPFLNRLRLICHILKYGEPFGDQIVLRKNSALELKEYIELHTRKGESAVNVSK